jgi:membrane protease YdiL (CAAX protease family)
MASRRQFDRDAIVAAIRRRVPWADVSVETINPDYGSWMIDVRSGDRMVSIAWGPQSGFGATDHQALREDANPFGPYDWPLETEDQAIEFVAARFHIVSCRRPMGLRTSLLGFCALAYGLTWLFWLPIGLARAGWFELPVTEDRLATLGQFGPFASAIILAALDGRSGGTLGLLGRLVQWRVNPVWFAVVLLLPPVCMYGAIAGHALVHGSAVALSLPGDASTLLPHLLMTLVTGGPLGEEPGWRGFALPRLQSAWHPVPASVLLGVIWAVWHLPLWWIADVPASFGVYLVGVIPLTYLFTWVFNHTKGSVLVALLFHASLNTSLVRLPIFPAWGEWTVLLWVVAISIGIVEWRRGAGPRGLVESARETAG